MRKGNSKLLIRNLREMEENKQCTLYDVVPMLRKAHDMLEVDFSKQTQKDQEEMTKIVEMCEAIKDDYWMYKSKD